LQVNHSKALPKAALSLLLALVAACVLIGINEAGFGRSQSELDNMAREVRLRGELNQLLRQVLEAESGSRGFLLTADGRYLEPYNASVGLIRPTLERVRAAHQAIGAQAPVLAGLDRDVQAKLAEMDTVVAMRRQGKEDAWRFVLLSDEGKQRMDAIRAGVAGLIEASATRVDASQEQVRRSLAYSRAGIAAIAVAALLAFGLYLRQTTALHAADEQRRRALQQERDLLEGQVRDRTAALSQLATHLQQVREDERGHLARELHDELGALLTAAKLDVARLKSRLGAQPPEVKQRLQHLIETLNSGIALKRRIIEDLRPSSLANLGLTASLEILAREFTDRSGVPVATQLEPVELEEAHQLTVYRLVQESLTNMAKYARARQASISVRTLGSQVEVRVRDDGQGFDAAGIQPSTHGLAGMRHRVEAAGGHFALTTRPGAGTEVAAVLPVLSLAGRQA
jgi:signal transduction histidine kinase